ncbi:hypothetical protein [Nioella nitratireducens]|uniref:hypothetical protein n=1 Tax=Nioella nitratireducens TaxID=1287720 RepID=UPI0011BA6BD1|nr:hypothetical protein [Nioella nitratireducens]
MADQRMQGGERPLLTGFYRLWMVAVFLGLIGVGVWLGYTWGIGGSILGAVIGTVLAGMVMMVLNTPEKLEAAIYTTLGFTFLALLIYAIIAFWGVRL